MAKVSGIDIKLISALDFFNKVYSLVFLNSKKLLRFQNKYLRCKKEKTIIHKKAIIIVAWKKILQEFQTDKIISKLGIGNLPESLGIINIKYIKNVTLIQPGHRADRNKIGL